MSAGTNNEVASGLVGELLSRLRDIRSSNVSFPCAVKVLAPELDPWNWLDSNAGMTRVVWGERDTSGIEVGVGESARVVVETQGDSSDCVTRCRRLLQGSADLRFYGGLSFDGNADWDSFGAGRFVVPRLTLRDGVLSMSVMDPDDVERIPQQLERVRFPNASIADSVPRLLQKTCWPTYDGWQSRVDEALSLIRAEVLEKIVLARQSKLSFAEPVNPIVLTKRLKSATQHCSVFCFDFGGSNAFLGATPERLFRRRGDEFESEVVAGTRIRGDDAIEDEKLAIELLRSDKDQREHDIVRKSIRQKLHQLVEHLEVDSQASILRLARKQHLRSGVRGTLKPGVDDGLLLKRLHPTPAVGGYPTENALPEISRIEPFRRGWYAAPIGWIGHDSANFAVAIRSGLVDGATLSLYSGAGIVRGSDPDEEWHEVENKIQDYVRALEQPLEK
ncbi:MAG: isochorismate synthase [Planctomycetota bacterium]